MISTQLIKSTTARPIDVESYKTINVLKWNNSAWKELSPYMLKTDGEETCANPGGVLFENFYQGCKVYDVLVAHRVYPSRFHVNKPEYLWWEFKPSSDSEPDHILNGAEINYPLYFRWRNSLWNCRFPIRYPNTIYRRHDARFSLCVDKIGKETRMDYLSARKNIYMKEYIRLVKKLTEYRKLHDMLSRGQNLLICEIDVPGQNKKGEYGKDCDVSNTCMMNIEKLENLMNDPSEPFGHGLCLAYSLLTDLRDNNLN